MVVGNPNKSLSLWQAAALAAATLALYACGGGSGGGSGGSSSGNAEPPGPPPIAAAGIYLKAGALAGPMFVDGIGSSARFNSPGAMVTDSLGNVWLEDMDPNADLFSNKGAETTLRAVDAAGNVKTIAWGVAPPDPLRTYKGLVADGYGNVYVRSGAGPSPGAFAVDSLSRQYSALATITPPPDLPPRRVCLSDWSPILLGVDRLGGMYCQENNPYNAPLGLYRYNSTGMGTVLAREGEAISSARILLSWITFDADGTGYFVNRWGIADRAGGTYVALKRISTSRLLSTVFENPTLAPLYTDGASGTASINDPAELQLDGSGNLYFRDAKLDAANTTTYYIRKLTPAGSISTIAGPFAALSGSVTKARLNFAVTAAGDVMRFEGQQLVAYTASGGKKAIAGSAQVTQGSADGAAAQARFNGPAGVALDNNANIYIADCGNHVVRKIDTAGNVTTLAGLSGVPGIADGTGSLARFNCPRAIVFDGQRTLYITQDFWSPRGVELRMIDVQTGAVTSVPGSNGLMATALAVDPSGKIYTNDLSNQSLRVYDPKGSGLAFLALGAIKFPSNSTSNFRGLAVDGAGNAYTLDPLDAKLRKISPGGGVSKLPGLAGDTVFSDTVGLVTDKAGNLFVADTNRHVIRKITPDGSISTVAGSITVSYAAAGALPASLGFPQGIALRQVGSATELVVADQNAVLSISLP